MTIEQTRAGSVLEMVAERLVAAARTGPRGAFWASVPLEERNGNDVLRNRSLSTGTPGVALFLAQHYRSSPSPERRYLLVEVARWLQHALLQPPQCLGFHHGFGGLVFAALEVADATGVNELAVAAVEAVGRHREVIGRLAVDGPVGLDYGLSGLLLVLCGDHRFQQDPGGPALAAELASLLLRRVRLAPAGVYWDRFAAAVGPAAGFAGGNAGIEYLLALLTRGDGDATIRRLHDAAMAYDRSLFDPRIGNWRDNIHAGHYQDVRRGRQLREAMQRGRWQDFTVTGDSIGWANGTAGILVARAWGDQVFNSEVATHEAELAWQRIVRESDRLSATSVFTLADGWGGVALSLAQYYELTGRVEARELGERIVFLASEQLVAEGGARTFTVADFPRRGLFNGEAGVGYLLLASGGGEVDRVLFPRVVWQPDLHPHGRETATIQVARACFPAASARARWEEKSEEGNVPLTLDGVGNWLAERLGARQDAQDLLAGELRSLHWESKALPGWFLQGSSALRRSTFKHLVERATEEELETLEVCKSAHIVLETPEQDAELPHTCAAKPFLFWSVGFGPPQPVAVPAMVYTLVYSAREPVLVRTLVARLTALLEAAETGGQSPGPRLAGGGLIGLPSIRTRLHRAVRWCLAREYLFVKTDL